MIGSADGTDIDAIDGHTDCVVVEAALGKLFNVIGPVDGWTAGQTHGLRRSRSGAGHAGQLDRST